MNPKTPGKQAALAAAKAEAACRRAAFTADVGRNPRSLTEAGIPTTPLMASKKVPAWAVWTGDAATIAALVAGREPRKNVDLALAYGLAHAAGRHLHLVLPQGIEDATLIRAAYLEFPITVHTHDWRWAPDPIQNCDAPPRDVTITRAGAAKPGPSKALLRESHGLRKSVTDLKGHADWVEELREWAEDRAALSPAHRGSYLAWHAYGMLVLKIAVKGQGLTVTAGIHFSAPEKKPRTVELDGPLRDNDLATILAAVEAGITQARKREAGPYKEHLLQENLARHRDDLGWPDPVIREFPTLRPGGGTGYIDFLRTERDGALHIVETKIGRDPFVVLQGLDYWIWAQANADLLTDYFERKRNVTLRDVRDTVVDYVLGDESDAGSGKNILSGYAAAHLKHLPQEMRWQLHRAHPIDTGHVRLDSLGEREQPPALWYTPKL